MCYRLMMLAWAIDDWFKARKLAWLGAPFSWLGDRFEDFGLKHGLLVIFKPEPEGSSHTLTFDDLVEMEVE
jgi:hypothetical protein